MRKNILTPILFFFIVVIAGIIFWERQLMGRYEETQPGITVKELTTVWGAPDSDITDKNDPNTRILSYRTISGFTTYVFRFDAKSGRLIQKYADD